MTWRLVAACAVGLSTLVGSPASGQYLFLDANGDGAHSQADVVRTRGSAQIDVWLQTDRNRDGSPGAARAAFGTPLSIFSYEFILRAEMGEVEWGKYTNLQPSMSFSFGLKMSGTDFYVGYGGTQPLAPGKHKLGTLSVRVLSGAPRVSVAERTPLGATLLTAFGSESPGRDGDFTLKLGRPLDAPAKPGEEGAGDWADRDGLEAELTALSSSDGGAEGSTAQARFAAQLVAGRTPGDPQLRVVTTAAGRLRVQVFDVQGRLVIAALDEPTANPGEREVPLVAARLGDRPIPSGVYFYRVEAREGTRIGRFLVLR